MKPLMQLVTEWREDACSPNSLAASEIRYCADALEAALREWVVEIGSQNCSALFVQLCILGIVPLDTEKME